MSWRDRLHALVCAGGSLALASCSGVGGPACNANPDPCCENQSPDECDAKKACEASGAIWSITTRSCVRPDPCDSKPPCNIQFGTPCAGDEKCGVSSDRPGAIGYTLCVPSGTVPVGGRCSYSYGPPGTCNGADDCVAGAVCHDGLCEALCFPAATPCPDGTVCAELAIGGERYLTTCQSSCGDRICDPETPEQE